MLSSPGPDRQSAGALVSLFNTGDRLGDELNDVPNPKPTPADKARFGKLASLYTAFSSEFAACALDICLRAEYKKIADPFGGMGTLSESARTRPVQLQVGDISPFAALSAAFRSAKKADIDASLASVATIADRIKADDEREFYARLLVALTSKGRSSLESAMTFPSAPRHKEVALGAFVAALSRMRLYKQFAGSNPTWVRRPDRVAGASAAHRALSATISAAGDFARKLPPVHSANRTSSRWSSIEELPIVNGSLDAIITSPPYANRTDYIRHYHPASELLMEAAGCDERAVRAAQIGTPLIRDADPVRPLPVTVTRLLGKIRNHASYASERYYYKGFLYYFSDMHDALHRMHSWLREGGLVLMVVQDTYYKDLPIPTSDLLIDIARGVGFGSAGRRDWRVHHYLSQLSPHSRRSMPNRMLNESVIALSK